MPAVELGQARPSIVVRLNLHSGKVRATSFLVDMNDVFEDFVVARTSRSARPYRTREFPQNAKGKRLRLDAAGQIKLEPDISWWQRQPLHVLSVTSNTSRINVKGIKHPDIYQLLSYTIAAGVPEGLLIYAKGEAESAMHHLEMANKLLTVVALDLTGEPDVILEQVCSISRLIAMQSRRQISRKARYVAMNTMMQ